ncbi:MAG: GyrI-like domain-containing protein [Fimbriimonadaceae bacterium]|nr:GyrI-like domain-containing protein [Fimbriimonadaceae bacterium]
MHRESTLQEWHRSFQAAVNRLAEAPDTSVEQIADELGWSLGHFGRAFAAWTGETPGSLRRRLRLERAAWRLVEGDEPVGEIALDVGFATPQNLAKAFQDHWGLSPTEFRKRGFVPMLQPLNGIAWRSDGPDLTLKPLPVPEITMEMRIEERPAARMWALRHIGPYDQIGGAFARLNEIVNRDRLPVEGIVALYLDDPATTDPAALRGDAGAILPVDHQGSPPEPLQESELPGGRYAIFRYVGAYAGLGEAWRSAYRDGLPAAGVVPDARPCFEHYLSMEGGQEPPVTDICIPIR